MSPSTANSPISELKLALALIMPESVAELDHYVQAHFGITLPDHAACPDHDAPLTFLAEAFFYDFPDILAKEGLRSVQKAIVMGSRKSGKTLIMSILHMLNATFKPRCYTTHVGASELQGNRCYAYFTAYLSKPTFAHAFKSSLISLTRFYNGATVEILSGSTKSVSGPTPQKLSVDEFDQWDYDTYQTAIQMTVPAAGISAQTWLISTRYSATGLLARALPGAAQQGYTVYRWCEWDTAQPCLTCRDNCLLHTWHNPMTNQIEPLCAGRLLRATGWRPLSDTLDKFTTSDPRTWAVQRNLANPASGGMIFDTWADEVHIRPAPAEALPTWRNPSTTSEGGWEGGWPATGGVDWGYSDPAVILVARWAPDGDLHITHELHATRLTPDLFAELAAEIAAAHQILVFHADPSEPASIEHWRGKSLPIYAAARRTIQDGITAIRLRLQDANGRATLFVDPGCPNLIRAIKAYKQSKEGEQPAKRQEDHPIDALRYLLEAGPPALTTGVTLQMTIDDYRQHAVVIRV